MSHMHGRPRLLLSAAEGDLENFYNAFSQAGAVPAGGYCPKGGADCDGLVLCGGSDVDTALYGQPRQGAGDPDRRRDEYEIALIKQFMRDNKPIFGICRGMQILNVALGGTLIQDLPGRSGLFHSGTADNVLTHPIVAGSGTFLHSLYGSVIHVNSLHHQAVDRLGAGLEPVAWSETGFPEAFQDADRKIYGVQFHPERQAYAFYSNATVDGVPLIKSFIRLCAQTHMY